MAIENTRQNEARDCLCDTYALDVDHLNGGKKEYSCRFEGETERERKNVSVVTRTPCLCSNAIMWVQEHDKSCFGEGGP